MIPDKDGEPIARDEPERPFAHRDDGTHGPPAPPADPDRACGHYDFQATVDVNTLTAGDTDPTIVGYAADVRIVCMQCGEPFRFIGMQAGLQPDRPMCSPDETEARLPIRPASSDHDFGLGIPGFAVTWREG